MEFYYYNFTVKDKEILFNNILSYYDNNPNKFFQFLKLNKKLIHHSNFFYSLAIIINFELLHCTLYN